MNTAPLECPAKHPLNCMILHGLDVSQVCTLIFNFCLCLAQKQSRELGWPSIFNHFQFVSLLYIVCLPFSVSPVNATGSTGDREMGLQSPVLRRLAAQLQRLDPGLVMAGDPCHHAEDPKSTKVWLKIFVQSQLCFGRNFGRNPTRIRGKRGKVGLMNGMAHWSLHFAASNKKCREDAQIKQNGFQQTPRLLVHWVDPTRILSLQVLGYEMPSLHGVEQLQRSTVLSLQCLRKQWCQHGGLVGSCWCILDFPSRRFAKVDFLGFPVANFVRVPWVVPQLGGKDLTPSASPPFFGGFLSPHPGQLTS